MAFMTVKLVPGVRVEQTPLLLQAGVIQSNNVRWRDGLPEKIGGWVKFFASLIPGPIRELWTWEDLNGTTHLAAAGGGVTVITGGSQKTVGPVASVRHPSALSTTAGSPLVLVTDTGADSSIYESVTLETPASIGGICIYPGNYPVVGIIDVNNYVINIGKPAVTTDASATPCTITSNTGSATFTVNLTDHGLSVGSNFSIVLPTAVGGVILSGFSEVSSVTNANVFTITAPTQASSVETVNYGNVGGFGIQLSQWVVNVQQSAPTIIATGAFTTDYTGIPMPPNPGWVVPGQPVLDNSTGQLLGTVASYGPVNVNQAPQLFGSGNSAIDMTPNTNAPGIIPGMSVVDTSAGVSFGPVVSYVGNTLTLSGVTGINSYYAFQAAAAWTTADTAITVLPPFPPWVTVGMQIADDNWGGTIIGTVASVGAVSVSQVANGPFSMGATAINMAPNTAGSIIPGMSVVDSTLGLALGTVASYVGSTLHLTAGAPFSSGADLVISALGDWFTNYYSIPVSSVAGVAPGMTVYDVNLPGGSNFLGTISRVHAAPFTYTGLVRTAYASGAGNIFTGGDLAANGVNPGMTVKNLRTGVTVGTIRQLADVPTMPQSSIILTAPAVGSGNVGDDLLISAASGVSYLVLVSFINYASAGMRDTLKVFGVGNDTLTFSSGSVDIITFTAPLAVNSIGANDILYSPGLNDILNFSSGTDNVLVLTAPIAADSAGANDALSFNTGPPVQPGAPFAAIDWCMFNFGSTLVINPQDGPIFEWDPTSGLGNAQLIDNAPLAHGIFLAMPEQMVVAYGASVQGVQDPMMVAWCDAGDFTTWTAAVNNQAGTFRLARGSRIVGGLQIPMQAMLWTDVGLWLMTYIGYPDVWGFSEVAQECGLISKKAAGVLGSQVFWMGQDKFWTFTGGQAQPLPCEVWDAVFQNLNTDLVDRIRCVTDTAFDGIGWFFPSLATKQPGALQENDSFVKFNRVTGEWDYGTPIDVFGDGKVGGAMISDMIDANVFGSPISAMTDSTGTQSQLMSMDTGYDAVREVTPGDWETVPLPWWFKTGLFLLSEGEDFLFVDRCRPDFKWRSFSSPLTPSAQIKITLYAHDYSDDPSRPPKVYGPFVCTDTTGSFDPRARGRYFSFKVEGEDLGSFVRLGAVKFRFSPDGRAG